MSTFELSESLGFKYFVCAHDVEESQVGKPRETEVHPPKGPDEVEEAFTSDVVAVNGVDQIRLG